MSEKIMLTLSVGLVLGPALLGQSLVRTEKNNTELPLRRDLSGDPLPPGALARLGSQRMCYPGTECLTFSPDGKLLAAADHGGGVFVVEVSTGKEIHHFQSLPDLSHSQASLLAFSPDGRLLALGGRESRGFFRKVTDRKRTLRIWDLQSGRELHRLEAGNVGAIAFSPDGVLLASGSWDGAIRLWDPSRGVTIKEWSPSRAMISHLEFSADGKTLISAAHDQGPGRNLIFHEWHVGTGNELRRRRIAIDGSFACSLSPQARYLAVPAKDGRCIRLLSPTTGKELALLENSQYPITLGFSRDVRRISAGCNDGIIRVWDTGSGKALFRFEGPKCTIDRIALSPDGKLLATTTYPKNADIHLWDLARGKELHVLPGHRTGPLTVAFSADGKRVITTSGDPVESYPPTSWADWSIRKWDAGSGKELGRLKSDSEGEVRSKVFSQDGTRLAVVNDKGILRLWDLVGAKEISRWPVPTAVVRHISGTDVKEYPRPAITGLFFLPDNKTVLVTSLGESSFRDFAGKELRKVKRKQPNTFEKCLLSPDGKIMAVSEFTGRKWEVCFQETETAREISRIPGYFHPYSMVFSPDGKTLATGDGTGTREGKIVASIGLWEVHSGRERCRFEADPGPVFSLAFSANGEILASAGDPGDYPVCLWEAASGKLLHKFAGHRSRLTSLVFSPDGRILVSGGWDNTALVWDVAGSLGNKPAAAVKLTPRQQEVLWRDLGSGDAGLAYRAMGILVRGGDRSIEFLIKNLGTSPKMESEKIDQWLAELDSQDFVVRQKASQELERAGKQAEPALRKVLKGPASLEVRRRVEALLKKMDKFELFSEHWRSLRIVEVLEHIGTAQARTALRHLAQRQDVLAQESHAALDRLAKRVGP
jgi:WD40 repeat protein